MPKVPASEFLRRIGTNMQEMAGVQEQIERETRDGYPEPTLPRPQLIIMACSWCGHRFDAEIQPGGDEPLDENGKALKCDECGSGAVYGVGP
jgi:hypothetical protein